MRSFYRLMVALLLTIVMTPAPAEEVVLGLSHDKVAITATFNGSELLIFGAVKRETPIPKDPLNVIVAIAGPSKPVIVRHKSKRLGIWVNTDSATINSAPSFYAVATSAPLEQSLSQVEDLRHKISIPRMIRSVGAAAQVEDVASFIDALIRIRTKTGDYKMLENSVSFDEQTLFRTEITLPSDLTEGAYPTRIFLTRNGGVVSELETIIDVHKVGIERWLFTMSREQPLIYGLMAVAIAVFCGWGASALFRLFLRG